MGIAITEDHLELQRFARRFLHDRAAKAEARAALDGDVDPLSPSWKELVELGWLGVHLPEELGGGGGTVVDLAVLIEEAGRALLPSPFLPTAIASTTILLAGTDEQRARFLPSMAEGSLPAGIAAHTDVVVTAGYATGDGFVLGAAGTCILVRAGDDVLVLDPTSHGVDLRSGRGLDPSTDAGRVVLDQAAVDPADVLVGAGALLTASLRTLAAAAAAGGAAACLDGALDHAKGRIQFGRPIGSFQAVKHRCADMLVAAESAAGAAWDAAGSLAAGGDQGRLASAVAATVAMPAFVANARSLIQVLGGIGYTWEHDAHLYLRRAAALEALAGHDSAADVATLRLTGVAHEHRVDLPPSAQQVRAEVRAFAESVRSLPADEQASALVDAGYVHPHWPAPWGRGAGAVEQLVIEEELSGIRRPAYGIGEWIIPTLIEHGTPEQVERLVRPSVESRTVWCQMFSEPDAGSDAAAVRTRGDRVEGGWRVNGQKVWTSRAHECDLGLATVRTDPEASKHAGLTMMVIDVHAPGVTIRPLRDITGDTPFNEVFLDDVFVPDDDVIGPVGAGWQVARSTLGNERVTVGSQAEFGGQIDLLEAVRSLGPERAAVVAAEAGRALAQEHVTRLLTLRAAARAVAGGEPGVEGNLTKLVRAESTQRSAEVALRLLGPAGALEAGWGATAHEAFLHSRMATIASGTSEITRNQIGERILGLPREPGLR